MLTLRDPIQLKIGAGLAVSSGAFCEQLTGNYDLMQARLAPKDLLFLMTAPPELPDSQPSMTTLVEQTSLIDRSSVTVDVVNNMVNRILLDGSSHFTYQDQVYITTILNRLGITQVEPFMQQIRLLRTQSESVSRLTSLYREELRQLVLRQAAGEADPALPPLARTTEATPMRPAGGALQALHTQIVNRLETTHLHTDGPGPQWDEPADDERSPARTQQPGGDDASAPHTQLQQLGQASRPLPAQSALSLYTQIFKRLDTARIYASVHAFRRSYTTAGDQVQNQTFRLAEHLRVSQYLQLTQLKQQIYEGDEVAPLHHVNHYETGQLLPVPSDAQEVLTQAAAAALVDVVDRTITARLTRETHLREQWLRLERAVRQTAENTLVRFESYHRDGPPVYREADAAPAPGETFYLHELRQFYDFYRQLHTEQAAILPVLPPLNLTQTSLTLQSDVLEAAELPGRPADHTSETVRQQLNQLTRQMASQTILEQLFPLRPEIMTHRLAEPLPEDAPITRQTIQYSSSQQTIRLPELLREAMQTFTVGDFSASPLAPPLPSTTPTTPEAESLTHRLTESAPEDAAILQQIIAQSAAQPPFQLPQTLREAAQTAPMGDTAIPPPAPSLQPITLTALEAESQNPAALQEELTRIDQQNRLLLQTIQERMYATQPPAPPRSDARRTITEALRALESPETVLREFYSEASAAPMVHLDVPPEVQALLDNADPATRTLYETVLRYQKDPTSVISQGLLKPGNMGALNAALKQAAATIPALDLTQSGGDVYQEFLQQNAAPGGTQPDDQDGSAQARQPYEQSELVLEYLQQLPAMRQTVIQSEAAPPTSVRFVHKQAQTELDETLLEQLQQRKTETVVKTESTDNTVRNQHHTEHIQQQNQVVTQTTEDITALINRTLARQMRTITDQVYHQMEKRLQTERSRRGRL